MTCKRERQFEWTHSAASNKGAASNTGFTVIKLCFMWKWCKFIVFTVCITVQCMYLVSHMLNMLRPSTLRISIAQLVYFQFNSRTLLKCYIFISYFQFQTISSLCLTTFSDFKLQEKQYLTTAYPSLWITQYFDLNTIYCVHCPTCCMYRIHNDLS